MKHQSVGNTEDREYVNTMGMESGKSNWGNPTRQTTRFLQQIARKKGEIRGKTYGLKET